MKIGVVLADRDFFYDVYALTKAFYPDDDVQLFVQGDEALSTLCFDRCILLPPAQGASRGEQKDEIKRRLYNLLQTETGSSLPWGTLCGIRPVHIPLAMLTEGMTEDAVKEIMAERYVVSYEKSELAIGSAKRELAILDAAALSEDDFALYLHLPLCPSICAYCSFSSTERAAVEHLLPDYLAAMEQEMAAVAALRQRQKKTMTPRCVYIGGGTPTSLHADELEELFSLMRKHFVIPPGVEITVEGGRPDTFTKEKLAVLKAQGVNRISVNPQSMQQKTLDLIGRSHKVEDVTNAVHMARAAGFDHINMDIIIGLPGETKTDVAETLRHIERLMPDALTVHTLALKRGSRIVQEQKDAASRGLDVSPQAFEGEVFGDAEEALALCYAAAETLDMQAYYLYRQKNMRGGLENTGFAKADKVCFYNILTMEERADIIAIGAGAISKRVDPDGKIERQANVKEIALYVERLEEMIEKKIDLYG